MITKNMKKLLQIFPLTHRQRYSYISPVDKPVYSLALTSLHELSAQMMTYSYLQSAICPELSVLGGAVIFRLGVEIVCSLIRGFKFNNKNNLKQRNYVVERFKQDDRATVKWIDRILLLDTVRDMQFYGIEKQYINKTIWTYYRPGALIASAANIYLCLNFLRGAHLINTSPEFAQFCSSAIYLTNLSLHDPKFLTPILIILTNFIILKKSRHPFLININHPANFFHCFNFAFMSGLLFVPIPGIYHFAYLGLGIGHILIRSCRYFGQDINRNLKKLLK